MTLVRQTLVDVTLAALTDEAFGTSALEGSDEVDAGAAVEAGAAEAVVEVELAVLA